VFVENLKTSTLHSMGLHESQLMDRNPRLIVLRCPAAGLTGDWSAYTGFGAQFDGLSGLAYLTGHHDMEMADTPATTYMDVATGPAGAFAVIAALHYREATGRGQIIELAQLENVLVQLGDVFVETQLLGEPRRMGNRDPRQAPQGVYHCRGERQWLAITVADDDMWRGLTATIGRPELAADPRYADVAGRFEHHDELDQIISAWAADQSLMEAFHALQAAGVAAGPQLSDEMLPEDPNAIARGWIRPLAATDVGTHLHVGHGSPSLGEDNEYVYKKVLGVDDDEYERLIEARVVTSDYLDSAGNFV
jgi:crotonobetainyl-CoA:carnitine CoA-transferase CaiB-like acyl-CoA transferase